MLKILDIHTYYGDSYVLQGISLEIPKETVVALLGRNGVGKTTLIRSIVGFTPARRGQILFNDRDITRLAAYRIIHLRMGLVPQGRRIFPSLTVKENLAIAARGSDVQGWDFSRIYALFPRLEERRNQRASTLSGGEQQMLAIARALMAGPELLLCDEISLGLAPVIIKDIYRRLTQINREGLTIVLVEQDIRRSLKASHYTYVMLEGKVVLEGEPSSLSEEAVKKAYFGI